MPAIQDQLHDNFCWGCGADNPDGLQLKSSWDGTVATATWTPDAVHAAGPRHLLNGGIIATVLDCHGVCTAIADAYEREGAPDRQRARDLVRDGVDDRRVPAADAARHAAAPPIGGRRARRPAHHA